MESFCCLNLWDFLPGNKFTQKKIADDFLGVKKSVWICQKVTIILIMWGSINTFLLLKIKKKKQDDQNDADLFKNKNYGRDKK